MAKVKSNKELSDSIRKDMENLNTVNKRIKDNSIKKNKIKERIVINVKALTSRFSSKRKVKSKSKGL